MTTGSVMGSNGSMLPGGPPPVNVHVVPAASARSKSPGEVMMASGTSTIAFVPTTRSARPVRRTGVRQDDGAESAAGRAELECRRP